MVARIVRDALTMAARGPAGVLLDGIARAGLKYGQVIVSDWNQKRRVYVGREDAGDEKSLVKLTITDPRVVLCCILNVSLAVGEGYMHGKLMISEKELFKFFALIACNAPRTARRQPYWRTSNRQRRQVQNISHHYDQGNDYYGLFLGDTMLYSCAYFKDGEGMSLDEAQHAKVDHLVAKLRLQDMRPNGRVLDVGCGWGHLSVEIAERAPQARVVGITLSKEQLRYARALAQARGVDDRVEFRLQGYQEVNEQFDRIISVGMFEHVGVKDYGTYFAVAHRVLVEDGIFVLHTITQRAPARRVDAWVDRYIFPGGCLPTKGQITEASEKESFDSEDIEDLAAHYARTLELWWLNHSQHQEQIVAMGQEGLGEIFYRMRTLWLIGSWAGFRHGKLGLTQLVLTKQKTGELRTRAHLYR